MKMKYVLPLVIFLALAIFLMVGLNRDPQEVPSPLIGKPAPEFSLPRLDDPNKVVSKKDMLGQVWLLNVWSSWCGSCRQECPSGAITLRFPLNTLYNASSNPYM